MSSKLSIEKISQMPERGRNTVRAFFLISTLVALLAGCSVPDHGKVWLGYSKATGGCDNVANCPALTDEAETSRYYQAIGAEDADGNPNFTLEQWKQQFGFQNATPIRAVYGNMRDLMFGREMYCWETQAPTRVVCYVNNYGAAPYDRDHETAWPNVYGGVNDAAKGDIHNSFGTVAMVYDPNGIGVNHDKIAFYAFGSPDADGNQSLIRSVALDGEGPKTVPRMCLACHSGTYQEDIHAVRPRFLSFTIANFLPFDVQSFAYYGGDFDENGHFVPDSSYDLDNQQEVFRQLNGLVLRTEPTNGIKNLINGLYSGDVNTPGATVPDDTYIPAGWDVDKNSRNLYRHVVRKYCRMCHIAQHDLPFENVNDFDSNQDQLLSAVCGFHSMPNAEVPFGSTRWSGAFLVSRFDSDSFWADGVAQSDLRAYFDAKGRGSCF